MSRRSGTCYNCYLYRDEVEQFTDGEWYCEDCIMAIRKIFSDREKEVNLQAQQFDASDRLELGKAAKQVRKIYSSHDPVNHPQHYCSHPSGIECIQVTEHYGFNIGNCIKYLWRAGLKEGAEELQDLKKAQWYLNREIEKRSK